MKQEQERELTKEDWQYIAMAVQDRFTAAMPKPGEPRGNGELEKQEARVMTFLLQKAYPRTEKA